MYVSIRQHFIKNSIDIKDNQLPFTVDTPQTSILELTSFKNEDMSSAYDYNPLLERILTSSYVQYPVYLFFESYSAELVETTLAFEKKDFVVLTQNISTNLYKVTCNNFAECSALFPLLYESGMDSLFNMITMSEQAVVVDREKIKFINMAKTSTPAFCFSDDLQGLFIIGDDKWSDKAFIKNEFLKESLILDEIDLGS